MLSDDFLDGRTMVDIEPLAAGDIQFGGIETELVENGGVDVGDVVGMLDGIKTKFIGCAMNYTGLYAATGEPDGEALWMMVTPRSLRTRRSAKLSAENHQCILHIPRCLRSFIKPAMGLSTFGASMS